MSADGIEQRQADLDERLARAEHRLEEREQNADELPMRSPFADMIFEVARANVQATTTAYQSGFEAGRHQGYLDGMQKAKEMIAASMAKAEGAT